MYNLSMRPVFKFLLPVTLALVLGAGVIGVLAWQVNLSAEGLRAQLARTDFPVTTTVNMTGNDIPSADTQDAALLALREGDLAALQKNWAEAENSYKKAMDLGGGQTPQKKYAQVLIQREKFAEASTVISELQAGGMRAEDVLLLQSIILLHTGKTSEALTMLTNATDSPQKHYVLGLASIVQGSHDTAKAEFTKVVEGWEPVLREYAKTLLKAYSDYEAFPQGNTLHRETLLARSLATVNECKLALPMLSAVIGQMGDYRDPWIIRGYCELSTEKYPQALSSLEEAYKLDSEKPEIQYFLGRTYLALEDLENAMTFLQYAIRNGLQPQTEARKTLAEVAEKLGQPGVAFDQWKAIAESPEATREDVVAFGETAIRQKRIPEFQETLQRAVAKWPTDSGLQILVGRMALSQGSRENAKAAFKKVLELDPTNAEAKRELEKL